MKSDAKTVAEYLTELPENHRDAMETVRAVVLENLPAGYEETMNWGAITYQVPLEIYPDTYNKQPLVYAQLASLKNYMTLYLMGIYGAPATADKFETAYRATGKRYDVGKSCVRFRSLDDLPLPLIAETIASFPVDEFVSMAKAVRSTRK
ncbi:MAG: DUF1801 domain-containing protein [Chloroflexi bacterium]|nr:DUF1801 domain-containing protein [Chloroflexota bacterium]